MKTLGIILSAISINILHAENILVLAAASTTDVLKECAAEYEKESKDHILFNFASSGTLARQISTGAPADIYISANVKWMDFLEQKKVIEKTTRHILFGNSMVLVVPKSSTLKPVKSSNLNLPALVKGRIVVGNIKSVPCGIYAAEIFNKYKWYKSLKSRLVMAENVRQALFFVERGEVDAGLVYGTDAKISKAVRLIATFPEDSHTPIRYPAALCKHSLHREPGLRFLDFLKGKKAASIFTKHGFTPYTP